MSLRSVNNALHVGKFDAFEGMAVGKMLANVFISFRAFLV
jgi:hypothetical protein